MLPENTKAFTEQFCTGLEQVASSGYRKEVNTPPNDLDDVVEEVEDGEASDGICVWLGSNGTMFVNDNDVANVADVVGEATSCASIAVAAEVKAK